MILTSLQTKEKLGIKTTDTLKRIVATGALKPVNQPKPGAKKYYMLFESRDVNAYLKSRVSEPAPTPLLDTPAPAAPPPTQVALGIISRLETLDQKIDTLAAMLDKLLVLWR